MAAPETTVAVKVEPSSTISEEKPVEKDCDNTTPELPIKEEPAQEVVNGENKDGAAIENNAEDIKSEEEEDDQGSLVLDDFLDSLDVLDSWNPDEDELEGIGEDQPQQSSEKEKKNSDDKPRRERSKDKGRRSRRDLDDKRSTRRRSSHRDRSGGGVDLLDLLAPKASRRRSVHRECNLERPARSRHFAEAAKDVKDLRELLPPLRHKDSRDHRDKARDYRRDYRDRDRDRDRHRDKDKPKEKQEKVVEKPKDVNAESDVKPPPGVVPAPRIKMPSDDLVPPGTEDEFWPKDEDSNLEPHSDVNNGTSKGMKAHHKDRIIHLEQKDQVTLLQLEKNQH